MSSPPTDTTNKISPINWTLIITLLGVLFGSGVIWIVIDRINAAQAPRFSVSVINNLGNNQSLTYEITNHFIGTEPTPDITLTWGLEVIPEYSGNKSYGEVRVLVKNPRSEVVAENKWINFDKDAVPLMVALDPYRLSSEVEWIGLYGGFQGNVFEGKIPTFPEAIFKIEIVQASRPDSPLATHELTIRNAPWYHYSAVSAWHNDSIDVFVYGENLGGLSDFFAVGNLFEITEVPGAPWVNWPWVDYQQVLITGVDQGEEFSTTLTFPQQSQFRFEKGKVYMVEIYLIKKQNYIQFSDAGWDSTGHKWRLGSYVTQHLLQP